MTRRTVVFTATGVVLAAAGGYWFLHSNPDVSEKIGVALPAVDANPELLSTQEATAQRALHYQDLETVAQTLELPSNFARREALHVIAGRADARQLRSLVAQAKRVSDPALRLDALEILLLRQVEIDPGVALRSALDMDRGSIERLVYVVFGAWSRSDVDAAIDAVKDLPSEALKTAASQAIFGSNSRLAARARDSREERKRLASRLGVRETSDAFALDADATLLLQDPHEAIESALALPQGDARRRQLIRIAQAWARVAPEEAWEHAANLPDMATRMVFESAVIEAWATEHPELAFAHVASLPDDWRRDQVMRHVIREVADRDPGLAMQFVSNTKGADRLSLQSAVLDRWARYDPAGAARWIEGQDRMAQGRLAFQVGNGYVLQNPEEALAWALRISRSPGRNLWSHMVGRLAAQDPQEALRIALSAENPAQRNQALSNVLSTIGATDPALALSHMDKLPQSMRSRAVQQIAMTIAEKNPSAAVDWLEGAGDSRAFDEGMQHLAGVLVSRDPDGAAALLDRVPRGARGAWISSIAMSYAENDLEKGLQWIKKYEDDPAYAGAMIQVARSLAMRNPEAALELVERTSDTRQRDQMLMSIIPSVASQSPETAVRYYARIADENVRASSVQMIASQWAQSDASAARKWVMSMPSSPSRDQAMMQLIGHSEMPVDDTLSMIGQMQSEQHRLNAVMMAAMRLNRTSPEDARTLLRRHPLDPGRQQQLEQMSERKAGGEYGW